MDEATIWTIKARLPDIDYYYGLYDHPLTSHEFMQVVRSVTRQMRPTMIFTDEVKEQLAQIKREYLAEIQNVLLQVDQSINMYLIEPLLKQKQITRADFLYRISGKRGVNAQLFYGTQRLEDWYRHYLHRIGQRDLLTRATTQEVAQYSFVARSSASSQMAGEGKSAFKQKEDRVKRFPQKKNQKYYSIKKVGAPGTYLIDLMFSNQFCYIIAINVNTKYLWVQPTNVIGALSESGKVMMTDTKRNRDNCRQSLQDLINRGWNPKVVISDAESGLASDVVNRTIWDHYHIEHRLVPRRRVNVYPDFMNAPNRTEPSHESMGILDRVVRTLRDMAYNLEVGTITPQAMEYMVKQYNHRTHSTLSKIAGFNVSPALVENDAKLEEYIVRKILQSNQNIINSSGFILKPGTKVRIKAQYTKLAKKRTPIQPGNYEVVRFEKGAYVVLNKDTGLTERVPRTSLDLL